MPYTEIELSRLEVIRTFSEEINDTDLLWHFDEEYRTIYALHPNDWQIQFDNELPQYINTKEFNIQPGKYHRLIKGTGTLKIYIRKC